MFSAMSDKSDCTELLVRSGAAVSNNTIDIYSMLVIIVNGIFTLLA